MQIPTPTGPLTRMLAEVLTTPPGRAPRVVHTARAVVAASARRGVDILHDDDLQVALTMLYELHYTGLRGVDEGWEWSPDLLAARAMIERPLEARVRELTSGLLGRVALTRDSRHLDRQDVADMLTQLVRSDDAPSLPAYLERRASPEQLREVLVHRSIYQLKEADPHSWAIPRLQGSPKVALVEIQSDEYGGGRPQWQHSALFATTRCAGLDDEPGAYVGAVPAVTLAHTNVMSLFGLHRRLRGALAGHLAALEMTSCIPNRRWGNALRRCGYPAEAVAYFDEHVEADAVHEQIAARDLCGRLVEDEPFLLADVLHGAAASLALDGAFAGHVLDAWAVGRSSLRYALADVA